MGKACGNLNYKELGAGDTYQSRSRLIVGSTRVLLGGVSVTYNSTEGGRARGCTTRHYSLIFCEYLRGR
jgi:hypothetical protein